MASPVVEFPQGTEFTAGIFAEVGLKRKIWKSLELGGKNQELIVSTIVSIEEDYCISDRHNSFYAVGA